MRTPLLVAAACTALVLVAGCGDDGSSSGAAEDETSASAQASPSEEPSDPAATPTSPSSTPTAPTTPTTPAAPDLPDCAQIWVEGQNLPGGYAGCLDAGAVVAVDGKECAFGRPLVIYGDRFYAVPGARVNRTAGPVRQDPTYTEALRSCSG